ncbi:MAG TPA: TonB family protein [Steroidobacteraceae bacterium]|jgi:protein TonB|nr:TonB family protein [Steroidobacteraceae bacterium]
MVREHTLEPRQFIAIFGVIVIHVGLLLALKNGLTAHVIPEIIHSTQAIIIETIKPQPEPKPVQPKVNPLAEPPPMPPPVIEPVEETPPDVIAVQSTPSDAATSSDTGSSAITALQVDKRYPLTRPEYPAASVRKAEEGTVELLLYVMPNGRVSEAKINRSSGFPRLDEAAIREAKRSWRFIPATSGGQAVASWGTFAVTFKLEEGAG